MKAGIFACFPLFPRYLGQCLAHSRCLLNAGKRLNLCQNFLGCFLLYFKDVWPWPALTNGISLPEYPYLLLIHLFRNVLGAVDTGWKRETGPWLHGIYVLVRVKQNKKQKTNDNSSDDCEKGVVVGRIAGLGVVAWEVLSEEVTFLMWPEWWEVRMWASAGRVFQAIETKCGQGTERSHCSWSAEKEVATRSGRWGDGENLQAR